MMRGAAAAAMRKKQPTQRKPTKRPTKNRGSGRSSEGSSILDKLTPGPVPFDFEKAFRVKFSLFNIKNEECVYYKDDEDRFTQRYTLKLRTKSKYKISIEVEEGVEVEHVKFGEIIWNKFHVAPNQRKESSKVDHTFLWCTNTMNLTKRKNRAVLLFAVKLKKHAEIEFAALVKFYDEDVVNHSKGVPLSFLSLEETETGTRAGTGNQVIFFSNIGDSDESDQVEHFKKQLQRFSHEVEDTEKMLEDTKRNGSPVCVSAKLIQIRLKDTSKVGLNLMRNTEFLEALCAFTNDKLIITPRIHRKLLQDKHDARHLLKKYEKINGSVRSYAKYTLKKQKCDQTGSTEISKTLIQVYKNFHVLIKKFQ